MERFCNVDLLREGNPGKPARHALFASERAVADVHVLRPGQAWNPHVHRLEDKCFLVLEGSGRARTGGAEQDVAPGTFVSCLAGEEHSLEATGSADLRVLVFMAPRPGSQTARVP